MNARHEMLRSMIVMCRLADEETPRVHAQMLSDLDRIQRAGQPCPKYDTLLAQAHAELGCLPT